MAIRVVSKAPKIDTKEDVARSAGTGLIEGIVSLPGAFGDMRGLAESLAGWAQNKMGAKGPAPKMADMAPWPMRVVAGAVSKVGEKAGLDPRIARTVAALVPGAGGIAYAPTSADIIGALGKDKPLYQPQTKWGERARTAGQFSTAALPSGTLVQRGLRATVPAITSQAAGELTKGTPYEPYARVAGAIVGGGGVEMATRGAPRERLLAQASRPATDAQVAQARQLMESAQQRGIQLTMPEALNQVTNNATGMGQMQRVIEATEPGKVHTGPVMAARPGQVSQAVAGFADEIAPPVANPYVLGQRSQEAAGDVLTGVRQQVNANARPWYDALEQERMPPTPAAQQVVQSAPYQQALADVRGNPVLNAPIANLPDDSLAVVNEVVKQLDTLAENARPNPASSTGNAQMAAAFDAARSQVDELASAYSEPWRLSRAMVASGREAFLEPLQAGPMGAISQTADTGGQTRALFPNAPLEGAPAQTGQTLQMLPQEVGAPLVRQHVMNTFNEAAQQNIPGENQWGGAKWAAQIAGNPEQQRSFQAGVAAVAPNANPDPLIEVLRATGTRERPGSPTAPNLRAFEELGKGGATGEMVKTIATAPRVFSKIGDMMQNWQFERNADALARAIVANPAEAEAILLHARQVVPPGAALQAIERTALAARLAALPHGER